MAGDTMGLPERFEKLTKGDLLLVPLAGVSLGLVAYALWPGGGAILAATAVALIIMVAIASLARSKNQVRDEVARVVAALQAIGEGKPVHDVGPLTAIAHGEELRSAVLGMAGAITKRFEHLHDRAHLDPLTGLCNRSQLEKLVQSALRGALLDTPQCLIFVDLDGFKQVNDTLGHDYGDSLLRMAAERLRLAVHAGADVEDGEAGGAGTHIARFGGDEFVVFLGAMGSGTMAQRVASRIVRVLSEPFQLDAHLATIGASVGCAFAPQHGTSFSALLKAADTAMYHAKNTGRNRYEFYRPELDVQLQLMAEQERELQDALANGQLELHFQPLFDSRTLQICSAEALVRWNHPTRGLLLPSSFMPIVERCNLTEQLGEWVLDQATSRIARLADEGFPLKVAVNISPRHIEHGDFATLIRSCLRRWKAPASLLQIEITEDAATSNAEKAGDQLRQLHELGVSTAIDDFGTGFSNLASLIDLPLSRLKIDRSLLTNLCSSSESKVLVQTIISMADSLGLQTVAEGVETTEQLELVSAMGCDIIQGYLLSSVLSFDDLRAALITQAAQADLNQTLKIAS